MTLVTIRETGKAAESFNAAVIFDRQGDGYPITIKDPYSRQEEGRLEWYFEEYPRFPFLETVRANKAAVGLEAYGKSLFNQVFGSGPKAYALYLQALQTGGPSFIALEIVGSPKFQAAGRGPSPRCVAGSGGYPEAGKLRRSGGASGANEGHVRPRILPRNSLRFARRSPHA